MRKFRALKQARLICSVLVLAGVTNALLVIPTHAASSGPQGGPLPAGTVVHAASCLQPPPQSVKDRAAYTPQELQAYGLPPRESTEPFSRWAQVVRSATVRFCNRTVSSARNNPVHAAGDLYSQTWVGWEANQGHSSVNYSETDMDYYEPCPDNSQSSEEAMWAGLGGEGNNYLVQTGTIVYRSWTGSTW
jgi:hypothetical protein